MSISPIEPITPAWNHMVRILFKPFDFKKWLLLGFCAFLAQCGEGGGGNWGNGNISSGPSSDSDLNEVGNWISNNVGLTILIASGCVLLFVLVGLLITWLSSRGKFMLLDGIVKNRGAVKEPWTEFKTEGNSLFLFRIVVAILAFVVILIIGAIIAIIASPDIQTETFGAAGITAIIVGAILIFAYIIFCIALAFFISAFLVPTMYIQRVKSKEGMRIAWQTLCKGNLGNAFLLGLMMFFLGIGVAVIGVAVTCATCCIAALPYVSSVVFLPVIVFFTCYALCYIQQFGPEWQCLDALCYSCGYDRQGLSFDKNCPECGNTNAAAPARR